MNILIVDDSTAMRQMVIRAMRQAGFGDHEYSQAEDGEVALESILDTQPDLVVCDWNMPNMNGIELLKKLGEHNVTIPFGFVTTESSLEMKTVAKEAGARFMISKPFTPEVFEKTLSGFIS